MQESKRPWSLTGNVLYLGNQSRKEEVGTGTRDQLELNRGQIAKGSGTHLTASLVS